MVKLTSAVNIWASRSGFYKSESFIVCEAFRCFCCFGRRQPPYFCWRPWRFVGRSVLTRESRGVVDSVPKSGALGWRRGAGCSAGLTLPHCSKSKRSWSAISISVNRTRLARKDGQCNFNICIVLKVLSHEKLHQGDRLGSMAKRWSRFQSFTSSRMKKVFVYMDADLHWIIY